MSSTHDIALDLIDFIDASPSPYPPAAEALLRLFSLTGVDHVIANFTTLDQAVRELPAAAIRPRRGDVTGLPRILSAS